LSNTITGFLETFVAAAADYNEAVVGQLALLDAVYKDVKPEVARAGKTINVYFPDVGPVVDQGLTDWVPEDINPNYVSLVFNQRPGKAILLRDFEQYLTAVEIRDKFVDPMFKRCAEYLNAQISSLITPANFSANAQILGATAGEVTVADQLNAWNGLANAKVPLENSNDLALLVHNNVYQKMLGDPQWVQENIASAMIAREARAEGKLANAFKFKPVWDQQMPTASATVLQGKVAVTNGSTAITGLASRWTLDLTPAHYVTFGNDATQTPYAIASINSDSSITLASPYAGPTATTSIKRKVILAGTVAVSNGSNAVTGTGTSFTTALNVGDWLIVQGDPTNTPYQVQSIASNTGLTLSANYTGVTASGKLATVQNYICLAMHRYAIALALRPLPEPDGNVVHFRYLDIKGIPMRLMASYQHLKSAWLVSLDFGYALAVIRPEFGQIIKV
jgi:hypothetical protein